MNLSAIMISISLIAVSQADDSHDVNNDIALLDVNSAMMRAYGSPKRIQNVPGAPVYIGNEIDMITGDPWMMWTEWSLCSRACGVGIRERTRVCRSNLGSCQGPTKQTKVCRDLPSCTATDDDFRHYQCSQHNNQAMFNFKNLKWIPYHEENFPSCTLTCLAENYNFFHSFGDAMDGTACGTRGVCISGECQNVGCDDVIGSDLRLDSCGVCGGDNSTCYRVYEVFDHYETDVIVNEYDYNVVHTIEAGASNIVIKDYSRNYIGILEKQQGGNKPIINGDFIINHSGVFEMSGGMLKYERTGDNEVITILGPTRTAIQIMILNFGDDPMMEYKYFVSLGMKFAGEFRDDDPKLVVKNKLDTIEDLIAKGINVSEVVVPSEEPTTTTTTTTTIPTTTTRRTTTAHTTSIRSPKTSRQCNCAKTSLNVRKGLCKSDFVVQAKLLYKHRGKWGKYSRFSVEIVTTFKSGFSMLKREYLWIAINCCTRLRLNKQYLLTGRKISLKDSSRTRSFTRLIVDTSDYWVPWKKTYQRRLNKLSPRRMCKRRRSA